MIKVGDYLYYRVSFGRTLVRTKIVRETPTQWILENTNRVKKDGLREIGGSKWSRIYNYYEETDALRNEYLVNGIFRKAMNKLHDLGERRNHYVQDRLSVDRSRVILEKVEALESELKELL